MSANRVRRDGGEPPVCRHPINTEVVRADARAALRGVRGRSVHCCVTSPPYFGLRDYRVSPQVWGGKPGCAHRWESGGKCRFCPAWRGCLGLEPDVEIYVRNLVEVMHEVRRVLRDDGSLWLVIGDSFAGARSRPMGLKPMDLLGVPWRVALALQGGWWLRSDVVWHKPDPMLESVADRPTRAHEFLFLLTERSRYFYDAEAVREPDQGTSHGGNGYVRGERLSYGGRGQKAGWVGGSGRNRRRTSAEALETGRFLQPTGYGARRVTLRRRTVGWEASCDHDAPGSCCRVLDPIAGAGTTGVVAAQHGRNFVGIELSQEYAHITRKRVRDACPSSPLERRRTGGGRV